MSAIMSFIDSPFNTKVEYEAWLKLPPSKQQAALEAKKAGGADETLAAAASSLSVEDSTSFEPLAFPPARVALVKTQFDAEAGSHGRLPLKRVHQILFSDDERKEYDFDTWDEDLQATCKECGKTMAWADVEKFLAENL